MRFTVSGRSFEITRQQIIDATRGVPEETPDFRNKYFVRIGGRRYPIKQLVHLVTGLPNIQFNAGPAHHILEKLGFSVELYDQPSSRTPPSRIGDVARFAVTLEEDEDGYIVASAPALPGCHSQGRTETEALNNIREAIRGYLASMRKHGEPIPSIKEVREIEVPV